MPPRRPDGNPSVAVAERLLGWTLRPIFQWAGLEIIHALDGEATVVLHVETHHRGGGGTSAINGAIAAYLFDCALGTASASVWGDDVSAQVTVTISVQYLRPMHAERLLTATSRVVRRGASLVFAAGEIRDEGGEVCATCTGIYRLFRGQVEVKTASSDERKATDCSSPSVSSS